MHTSLIALAIGLAVLLVLLSALFLQFLNKLFGIRGSTYKQTFLTLISYAIVAALVAEVGNLVGLSGLFYLLGFLAGSSVAYLLYKKYSSLTIKKFILLWLTFLVSWSILAIAIAIGIRIFVIEPFVVSGNSMSPAYVSGDYLMIEKWDKSVEKNDVVITHYPDATGGYVIRRIAGIPGDSVNGTVVPQGEYYLVSDSGSTNAVGLVSANAIVGKPILKL